MSAQTFFPLLDERLLTTCRRGNSPHWLASGHPMPQKLHRFDSETCPILCRIGTSDNICVDLVGVMRYLKTSEAAALLNVSPNTLRAWERRFGFPKPQRSQGKHRLFTHGEVVSLCDALQEGLSISLAVASAVSSLAEKKISVGHLHNVSNEQELEDHALSIQVKDLFK